MVLSCYELKGLYPFHLHYFTGLQGPDVVDGFGCFVSCGVCPEHLVGLPGGAGECAVGDVTHFDGVYSSLFSQSLKLDASVMVRWKTWLSSPIDEVKVMWSPVLSTVNLFMVSLL